MDLNRKTAFEVLTDIEQNGAYSNLALNNRISKNAPDRPALVREIVYGVIKNRRLIDFILDGFIRKGTASANKRDLILMRMGVYQIGFMDSVPGYAAVNETVKMAGKLAKGREGFINGVLRAYMRAPEAYKERLEKLSGKERLETVYSAGHALVDALTAQYGDERTEKILSAANETPKLALRANTLKNTREELINILAKEGFTAIKSELTSSGVIISEAASDMQITETVAFREGRFSIQDEASLLASETLGAEPGELVIDVCAAPGGKTLAAAEMMKNSGRILASDIYENKLGLITEQAERLGITIVETSVRDAAETVEGYISKADRVICDVPCSGFGVIRRKPEIKYKDTDDSELQLIQRRILKTAASYVKQGGTIVYSTCTVLAEENEEQIEFFLKDNPGFVKEFEKQLLPDEGTDGFYICRLKRVGL